jgi:hypothetical protein
MFKILMLAGLVAYIGERIQYCRCPLIKVHCTVHLILTKHLSNTDRSLDFYVCEYPPPPPQSHIYRLLVEE